MLAFFMQPGWAKSCSQTIEGGKPRPITRQSSRAVTRDYFKLLYTSLDCILASLTYSISKLVRGGSDLDLFVHMFLSLTD
mmetsp:Transcript_20401/g.50019  ORF Transcript_20401/g.50019 Transcript_20401/m.50019 type:complete len:80 (-) Transcript_20401:57-296(-)